MCNDRNHSQFKTLVQTLEHERRKNEILEQDNRKLRKELADLKKQT